MNSDKSDIYDLSLRNDCPVSGLPLYTDPDWHFEGANSTYRIRLYRVGDRIVVRTTTGKSNRDDAKKGNQLHAMVEASILRNAAHYVMIEDFSGLTGYSLASRRAYIDHFEHRPYLKGLIFIGVSRLLSVSIRMAVKMFNANFPVKIAQSYAEAISFALEILADAPALEEPIFNTHPLQNQLDKDRNPIEPVTGTQPEIISRPEWVITDDGYRAEYKIINGHILLAVINGYFRHTHIEPTMAIQRTVFAEFTPSKSPKYMIADVREMTGISFRVRLAYIGAMNRFFKDHPFRSIFYCGPSKSIRSAIFLGRPMAKFPVLMTRDVEEALQIISDNTIDGHRVDDAAPAMSPSTSVIDGYVDDVLNYLSNLSNSAHSKDYQPIEHPADHPFHLVFDTIDLVHADIYELLERRLENEREKLDLEKKLALAQKMEAIGLLAGGVAHDLNNVLSGMATYPQLLLMGMDEEDPMHRALLTIQESGNKAAAIVQDLLTLTRRGVYLPQVIDLNQQVREFVRSKEHNDIIQTYHGLQANLNLASEQLAIKGSPVHIQKTLMNLILNGAEAHKEGEPPSITISTARRFLQTPLKGFMDIPAGEYVVLSVADQGIGIEAQHIPRIFEPFYTRKQMGRSGTGLGMTVVWGAVHDHQAHIDIQSTLGTGTTFLIYFPACHETGEDNSESGPGESLEMYRGNKQMVLVIDDIATQREIACAILRQFNYNVAEVSSGEEAIAFLRTGHADLLLLDMEMAPGLDGYQTYKALIEFKPDQRVVIASGYTESEKIQKMQSLGITRLIKKPYSVNTLIKTVYKELHPA